MDSRFVNFDKTPLPAGDADVGSVVVVGIIMHTTWEGSGLHVPLSTHTELGGDGANPDC